MFATDLTKEFDELEASLGKLGPSLEDLRQNLLEQTFRELQAKEKVKVVNMPVISSADSWNIILSVDGRSLEKSITRARCLYSFNKDPLDTRSILKEVEAKLSQNISKLQQEQEQFTEAIEHLNKLI